LLQASLTTRRTGWENPVLRMKTAVLDMMGAGCTSCAYAIERVGRKTAGIHEVRVDIAASEVRVQYEGAESVLDALLNVIRLYGHDARIRGAGPAETATGKAGAP